jgi:hypothetical protein
MIGLSRDDWSEIFYALESKSLAVRQGQYGSEDAADADSKWIAHLDELRQKIGPDGESGGGGRPTGKPPRLVGHAPNLGGDRGDRSCHQSD